MINPPRSEYTFSAEWLADIWSTLGYYANRDTFLDTKLSATDRSIPARLARQNLEIRLNLTPEQVASISQDSTKTRTHLDRAFPPMEYFRYGSYLTTILNRLGDRVDTWVGFTPSGFDSQVEILHLGYMGLSEEELAPDLSHRLQDLYLEWSASQGLHCFRNPLGTITVNFRNLRDKLAL